MSDATVWVEQWCVINRDVEAALHDLPSRSVNCVVTSPPYWGLRDYGVEGQIGLERTPEAYVERLVSVFREVRRVLREDGTLWLNLGDSYASGKGTCFNPGGGPKSYIQEKERFPLDRGSVSTLRDSGLKPKDLVGIPWRVAFALQADGWWLRQDIIWAKPNPMPESVKDRCTKSHEYLFLLSKSARYYYDAEAIAEPVAESTVARLSQPTLESQVGSDRVPGKTNGNMKAVGRGGVNARTFRGGGAYTNGRSFDNSLPVERDSHGNVENITGRRNRRSVWTIATQPYREAHFATFPEALVEPCILAGCPVGGIVLDPFLGSGTTLAVAKRLGRDGVGIELNPAYVELARDRIAKVQAPLMWDASHDGGGR
jgi:DNA modification methylase